MATHPLELVHLNYLCLEPGKGLEESVLVVTDHFTRYAQAYVTRTQTTQTTAKTLWDKFIVHYGLPEEDPVRSRLKFWESVDGWPLYSWWEDKRYRSSPYYPSDQQLMAEVQLHSDWYAGNVTPWEEARVEEPHWNVGSFLQLYLKFSYRVKPLLSHVWKTTPASNRCYTWLGTTHKYYSAQNTAKFIQKMREHAKWAHKKAEDFPG